MLHGAVKALTIIAHVQQKGVLEEGVQSMIFFLTDGHPTRDSVTWRSTYE
jgi:hypothetical protein